MMSKNAKTVQIKNNKCKKLQLTLYATQSILKKATGNYVSQTLVSIS